MSWLQEFLFKMLDGRYHSLIAINIQSYTTFLLQFWPMQQLLHAIDNVLHGLEQISDVHAVIANSIFAKNLAQKFIKRYILFLVYHV